MATTIARRDLVAAAAGLAGCTALGMCTKASAADATTATVPETWDYETDVVVIGSGTVLAGAVKVVEEGLDCIVLEKAGIIGGTTITSGGKAWIPCNHQSEVEDTYEAAKSYLEALNKGNYMTDAMMDAYIENGPEMIDFLIETTGAQWSVAERQDQYQDWPGATVNVRSMGVPDADNPSSTSASNFQLPQLDYIEQNGGLAMTNTPAKRLVTRLLSDGRQEVLGVIAETKEGNEISIKARRGVVIGTGSMDWNRELCELLMGYTTPYTWALPACTGDGYLMAAAAGGASSMVTTGWGIVPQIYAIDKIEGEGVELPIYSAGDAFLEEYTSGYDMDHSGITVPRGSFIVSRRGQRFYPEPGNYSTMQAWVGKDAGYDYNDRYLPYSFYILDGETAASIDLDTLEPRPGWLTVGNTFEELAENSQIDVYNFVNTCNRWNRDAQADGVDTEYGRTGIKPLGDGPYYAIKCCQFLMGSHGGIRVDEKARVVATIGGEVPRLYATSNAAATLGTIYGGNGGSIGPGMVFGYIAAKDLATLEDWA